MTYNVRGASVLINPTQPVHSDRYNPQNLQVLIEYLAQQVENQEYDCLANLAILKL